MAPLNPVLRRELKERMRSRATPFVLTLYLAALALVLYALYVSAANRQQVGVDPLTASTLGRTMFESLLFAVLLLVCFLVPGYTASAIVGERERQTLVPLQVTLLPPRAIVVGKLLASLAYLSLLVLATVPLLAASFLFGGVTLSEMLRGVAMVMATGVLLAALSLLVSSFARRVQTATVLAYGLTLLLAVGTFAIYGFEYAARGGSSTTPNKAVLVANPLVATADAVAAGSAVGGEGSPMSSLRRFLRNNTNEGSGVGQAVPAFANAAPGGVAVAAPVPGGGVFVGGKALGAPLGSGPPYAAYALVLYAVLTAAALGLTVRRITTPGRSDRA